MLHTGLAIPGIDVGNKKFEEAKEALTKLEQKAEEEAKFFLDADGDGEAEQSCGIADNAAESPALPTSALHRASGNFREAHKRGRSSALGEGTTMDSTTCPTVMWPYRWVSQGVFLTLELAALES